MARRSIVRPHIVDELIEERAPNWVASPLWWILRPCLNGLLCYGGAVKMADGVKPLGGAKALDQVWKRLNLDVRVSGLTRLPAKGRCLVVCNHPTGIADGIAVYDAIRRVRQDAIFFANADALRVCARLDEVLIPVEWVETKRTREKTRQTLNAAREAFEAERCVVMFPAGRLARRGADGSLIDPPWAPTAVSLAQKYDAPVIPMHLKGPNSFWFHSFDRISTELRDITLFHEFLNKAGKRFDLALGLPILAGSLSGGAVAVTEALKAYVETALKTDPDRVFALPEHKKSGTVSS